MARLLTSAVRRNFVALFILQAGTYVFPLLLVPYLIRVLGFELFGLWMFALSFVIFARICVNYGFDLTATRQVAMLEGGSKVRLSELVSDVISVRLIIWLLCFAVVMVLAGTIERMAEIQALLAIAFFILFGEALFPVWLFQGMQRMTVITQVRLGAKLVNLGLVLLWVRGPEDLLLVPLFEASTMVVAGALALVVAWRYFDLRPAWPDARRIVGQFREGGAIFGSNVATQFYTTTNTVFLGFLGSPGGVGAYALAEKIYSAIWGLLGPFIQAIFPKLAQMHERERDQFSWAYRKVLYVMTPSLLIGGIVLFAAAGPLVWLASGAENEEARRALQIFAISFPFSVGGFLSPMLVVRGKSMQLMRITIGGGIIGVISVPPLIYWAGPAGAATGYLLVQIYNAIALIIANGRPGDLAGQAQRGDAVARES